MRIKLPLVLGVVTLLLGGCDKNCPNYSDSTPDLEQTELVGTWEGTISLTMYEGTDSIEHRSSDVHFELHDHDTAVYVISGSAYRFPPAGHGVYCIGSHTLAIHSTSIYTTEFDWRLIPWGTFEATNVGDSLWLSQYEPLYDWRWRYALKRVKGD